MKEVFVTPGAIVAGIATLLFLSFVLSWPVMMLWNGCLVGAIDGVQEITWLQAWGLQFLFALLFKASISTETRNRT
jgi:type III secretory pathway component EscS